MTSLHHRPASIRVQPLSFNRQALDNGHALGQSESAAAHALLTALWDRAIEKRD